MQSAFVAIVYMEGSTKTIGSEIVLLSMHDIYSFNRREATKRRGLCWSLSLAKRFFDSDSKDMTQPMRLDCENCLMHSPLFGRNTRNFYFLDQNKLVRFLL